MKYRYFNPNKAGKNVGDCTVRAICGATGETWERVYTGLCLEGFAAGDMPSANAVWGAYLRRHGYGRHIIPNTCPDCYTVEAFAADHPKGTYILALDSHVVCLQGGILLDTWDSGAEVPLYYWTKEK